MESVRWGVVSGLVFLIATWCQAADPSGFTGVWPCIHFHEGNVAPNLLGAAGTMIRPSVNLFEAQRAGQLQVGYRPRNERSAQVTIRNQAGQPLLVQLPAVFAARPILAQQMNPFFGGNANNSNSNQTPQAVAGPFQFSNRRNGANNQQPFPNIFNQFSIPAEGLVQFDVVSVCLEQGKSIPTIGARYELVPLDEVLADARVVTEVLIEMRDGVISQRVAQAVAWHASALSQYMSWENLTGLKGERTTIGRLPYFTAKELHQAQQCAGRVQATSQEPKQQNALLSKKSDRSKSYSLLRNP